MGFAWTVAAAAMPGRRIGALYREAVSGRRAHCVVGHRDAGAL
ncbi:MAG: hypothetical protein ACOX8I_00635 [Bacillota bacterium]